MRIEQLQYFLDLELTKSITKTAERFFISQQAVSYAIKNLEKEFDITLVKRSKTGVLLTPEGEEFALKAQQLLEIYNDMYSHDNCEHIDAQISGSLRLVIQPRIFALDLNKFIILFLRHYPKIHLSFVDGDELTIQEQLHNGNADVGLILKEEVEEIQPKKAPDLTYQDIFSQPLYFCFAAEHPLSKKRRISLADVLKYNVTVFASLNEMEYYRKKYPKALSLIYSCKDVDMQHDLIGQGLAVGILTKYESLHLRKKYPSVVTRKIPNKIGIISAVYLSPHENHLLKIFIQEMILFYEQVH